MQTRHVLIDTMGTHDLNKIENAGRKAVIVTNIRGKRKEDDKVVLQGKGARLMIQNVSDVDVRCEEGTRSGAIEIVNVSGLCVRVPMKGTIILDRCRSVDIRLDGTLLVDKSFKIFHNRCRDVNICRREDSTQSWQTVYSFSDEDASELKGTSSLVRNRFCTAPCFSSATVWEFQTSLCDEHGQILRRVYLKSSPDARNVTTTISTRQSRRRSLRVVTYNVWFHGGFYFPNEMGACASRSVDEHKMSDFEVRTREVIRILKSLDPDIICLQEMTRWSRLLFKEDAWIRDGFVATFDIVGRYGVAMLVSRRCYVEKPKVHEMETRMGRNLLHCKVSMAPTGETDAAATMVHVATAHFESLSNAPVRKKQLIEAEKVASREKHCACHILTGDFNFCSYRNYSGSGPLENNVLKEIMPAFVDLWPALRGDSSKGYTFDSKRNMNIRRHERMRYDRILFRSCAVKVSDAVRPKSICMM